jgi:tryptophan synthase alpha chain
MNRIAKTFAALKAKNEKALVAYLTAGDPNYETSLAVLKAACDAGVDVLEMGMPFSDPTADGQVIQDASLRALAHGMNLPKSLAMAKDLRKHNQSVPIILFSYYNPLFQMGPEALYAACMDSGIDGILVVDLPPEESDEFTLKFPDPKALPIIRLIAPTTPLARKKAVAAKADGFLYLITRTGVTGVGSLDVGKIAKHATELHNASNVPVCLGFGISTAEDIRQLAPYADGLVVGSALVKTVAQNGDSPKLLELVTQQVKKLKAACLG